MEGRAIAALQAVHGPGTALGSERRVPGRVPVLRGEYRPDVRAEAVHVGEDGVPTWYAKRSARAEVVLRIDDEKRVQRRRCHQWLV